MFKAEIDYGQAKVMKIENCSAYVVKDLLRFTQGSGAEDFFSARVAPAKDNPQVEDNDSRLFEIAAKNDFGLLKNHCEEVILRKINNANALDVLFLGNSCNSERLKTRAFEEIKKMFPGRKINESLKDDPDQVKKLLDEKFKSEREVKALAEKLRKF